MSEKDTILSLHVGDSEFILAIQAILMQAKEAGWPVEKIIDTTQQALGEFEDENPEEDEYNREDE